MKHQHRSTRFCAFALSNLLSLTCFGGDLTPTEFNLLKAKAAEAQSACSLKIHFDTYAYERCIDELSQKYKKDEFSRLGIDYGGFALALSTTRVGMEGSVETAQYFYWRYKPLQTKLGIDDMSLCSTVPGNCKIRVAQTIELAKSPKPKKTMRTQKLQDQHTH